MAKALLNKVLSTTGFISLIMTIGFGTIAYVIDSGEHYVLNSSGVWTP